MKRRIIPIILAVALCLGLAAPAIADSDAATAAADRLNALGLFKGVGDNANGTPNYDLDREPNRMEAVTMLVRLVGGEAKALSRSWTTPFTDVDEWAKPYVGYAYANGLTNGVSATEFGAKSTVSATQYLTFVLRALDYSSGTDFQWDKAWELTDELGITNGEYSAATESFKRADVAIVSSAALDVTPNGHYRTLLDIVEELMASVPNGLTVQKLEQLGGTFYDYAEEFSNGYAFAVRGNDCGYIDMSGKFIPCYKLDSVSDIFDENSNIVMMDLESLQELGSGRDFAMSEEGIYPYYDAGAKAWGYASIVTGETIIEPAYCDAFPFANARAIVCGPRTDTDPEAGLSERTEAWIIDTTGKKIRDLDCVEDLTYVNGVLRIADDGRTLVIDRDGRVLADIGPAVNTGYRASIHRLNYIDGGYILNGGDPERIGVGVVAEDGFIDDFYYINSTGMVTLRLPEGSDWGSMMRTGESSAFYVVNHMAGVFDETGKLTEPLFTSIYDISGGVAMVSDGVDGGPWFLIGDDGIRIGNRTFTDGGFCRDNGLIPAAENGRYGYIDTKGNDAIAFRFDMAYPFSAGVGTVYFASESFYSLINTKGEKISGDLRIIESFTSSDGYFLLATTQGYCHVSAVY